VVGDWGFRVESTNTGPRGLILIFDFLWSFVHFGSYSCLCILIVCFNICTYFYMFYLVIHICIIKKVLLQVAIIHSSMVLILYLMTHSLKKQMSLNIGAYAPTGHSDENI
jgi:hypothetical protein